MSFGRRRQSAQSAQLPFSNEDIAAGFANEDSNAAAGTNRQPLGSARGHHAGSIASAAGTSSSYNLPSRSYIHHAGGHGTKGMYQGLTKSRILGQALRDLWC
jgi:hypothetical protein